MLKGHALQQIRYANNCMQNEKQPKQTKIHSQVETAVLFLLFYGELVQNCHPYLFPPTNLFTPPKKGLPGLDSFLMSRQDFLPNFHRPEIFFRQ
jgi:hypothetical protein